MRTDGIWCKDEAGRTLLLRGVNVSGSNKLPVIPNGATHIQEDFFKHRDVSFVGRPFPLEEADEHFRRLREWGLVFLRYVVTWEAVEHAGPGQYDREFLRYLRAMVEAAEHEINVFIDPHQDVWSRWTGGSGAPGWTFDTIGMDITCLYEAGAAITHQQHGDPFPQMVWPTNYFKLGCATMLSLFFGGNDFAPHTTVDGTPIQEYLQSHFINAIVEVARCLHGLPNVVGYDTLNEPGGGFIGLSDLDAPPPTFLLGGSAPTPYQSMLLGAGYPQDVGVWQVGFTGPMEIGHSQLNPDGISVWNPGYGCVWKNNGVWTDEDGVAQLLRPQHFLRDGQPTDFVNSYLKPFALRFIHAIRAVAPDALIFLEGAPGGEHPKWELDDPSGVINAAHWYDALTLFTKSYNRSMTINMLTGMPVLGASAVQANYAEQIGAIKQMSSEEMGGMPTLIGEFGVPYDLDNGAAFKSGDFSTHVEAFDTYCNAMDQLLLNYTIWNYCTENTNEYGDEWNGEDLSIWSRDQQNDPSDINSGGRALAGFVRPYALKTAGTPQRMSFDLPTKVWEYEWLPDATVTEPTEVFVPALHYPNGYEVELSSGSFEAIPARMRLLIFTDEVDTQVRVRIRPR